MKKDQALKLLGASGPVEAARALGITPSAVSQWPDELPPRIEDRVLAAIARRERAAAATVSPIEADAKARPRD